MIGKDELEEFLSHLRLERSLAQNTTDSYRRDLERYLEDMDVYGVVDVADIEKKHVIDHITLLRNVMLAESTVARATSAIRHFHRFLLLENLAKVNPTRGLPLPKVKQKLPEYLTIEDATRLVESPSLDTALGVRDRAMLELLWACGLRVSELVGLGLEDVFWDQQFIRVLGKGNKMRVVPIGKTAIEWVRDHYLKNGVRSELAKNRRQDQNMIFLSIRGRPLTRDAVYKIIRGYASSLRLHVHVTPHIFRHTFATHLINQGADIRIVQEMLGHADISSTQIYTHVEKEYLKEVHERCHPRARV
ncbi:site-specific tyrosine recombinase XerD [bacterium]|nr:site-specific tyrosine recombinase XerD [bacterium]